MLIPNNYAVKCEVHGCDSDGGGTLEYLNNKGWRLRSVQEGKLVLMSLQQFAASFPVICPVCATAANYKTMLRGDG